MVTQEAKEAGAGTFEATQEVYCDFGLVETCGNWLARGRDWEGTGGMYICGPCAQAAVDWLSVNTVEES